METFLLNLLKTSLLGSLAVLTMLALKPLWRERYRAKTRCWLWLALALFLLFPVDFSVKNAPVQAAPPKDYTLFVGTDKTTIQSTDNLFGDMAESSGQTPTEVRDAIIERPVTNPEQKTTRYIPVTALLFGGYLAGAAAFLLYQGGCYVHFRRTVRRWKRDVSRADYAFLLCDTARALQVSAPEMIVCEAISTPAVTGLLRPRLLLPHERYDVQELRYILRHELCHLKRRDMLFKLVLLAANAMHWFNPIVYLMLRQADEDIELACDSAATDDLDRAERAAYSRTLLAAVQSNVRALPATTCFGSTVERLKRRITNVLGAQKKRGLGVVALVLALTLTAGCAVSWGERAQASSPFDGTFYQASLIAWDDGMTAGSEYAPFLSETNRFQLSASPSPTLAYTLPHGTVYSFPMRKGGELTQENFDDAWSGEGSVDLRALRENSAALWCRFPLTPMQEAPGSSDEPNLVYLSQQNDGSLFLFFGYCYKDGDAEVRSIRWIYQLEQRDDTIYASMDDYAAKCVEDLKQGTMTYYVRVNGMGVVEDTVADVRVTQLELGDSLEGLSPDGTALELWYFNYEMKPTNEAGVEIDPVGGQYVTDDGFLRESWTHYLTVLHHTSGEQTGYQIIGTTMSNDGLFYNGCGYGGEEKAYLHDFYVDYAGINEPKMFIPNLLNAATDGYGYANQCEARLVAGEDYYYYVPITAWARSSDAEFWYSRYDTGSYFSVEYIRKDVDEALREWTRQGYEVSRSGNVYRIVTNEGMSNTVVTFFSMLNSTCYQVETHWSFDGSTAENEWGWNRDRAVEGEAAILQAMTDSFTITAKILPTQEDAAAASTGFGALDEALDALGDMSVSSHALQYHDLAKPSGPEIEEHTNTNIDYRTTMAEQFRRYSWKESRDLKLAGNYRERFTVSCGRWNFVLISNHKNALNFFDTGDGQGEATFYSYEVTDAGMETAVWDAFCKWYEKTAPDSALDAALKQLGDTTRSASLTLMLNGGKRYEGSATDNRVYFSRQLREDLVWRETNKTSVPQDGLCIAVGGSELNFSEAAPMNLWLTTPDGTLSCFKADVNEDIGSAWSLVRRWYDEAEYDALLRDVKPQPKSLSWQEAAQNWADDYYSAHTKAASGSLFKYTWVKALITPAEDTTKAMRERGEIDENTFCFYVEVQFTPESEMALHYAMAGNTGDCTDPSAPKGAYACWRCCIIQLGSDGLWHGVVLGTGW